MGLPSRAIARSAKAPPAAAIARSAKAGRQDPPDWLVSGGSLGERQRRELGGFPVRWHQADHRGGQPVRARQSHRAGPEHAGVLTCRTLDGGNGVAAVFANEMHHLDAVERAAFAVRGVV
jgi:hypothetical protein